MKKSIMGIIVILISLGAFAESKKEVPIDLGRASGGEVSFDPELVPVEEEPGSDAEVITEVIHAKTIEVLGKDVKLKWTTLGYGGLTEKVIIQQLAGNTLFNHRNPGEEGPCLRSYRFNPEGNGSKIELPESFEVSIKAINQYEINREKRICKVTLLEEVETTIDGTVFNHIYRKPMGFRYIGDCPSE